MNKDLKDKAIDIKGKKYVLVSDRVIYFNETYPNGSIVAELVSPYDSELIIVKSTVTPDIEKPLRIFVDYSQAIIGDGMVNKTAALENASTSATGRALAMMGIGVIESIASADEMNKAQGSTGTKLATPKQIEWMLDEADKVCPATEDPEEWLEALLTIPVSQVPIYKVKDAVDLIRKQSKGGEIDTDIVLSDKDLKDFKNGKLPY